MKRLLQKGLALALILCLALSLALTVGAEPVYVYWADPPGDVPPPAYRSDVEDPKVDYVPGAIRGLGEPVWYSEAVYDLWYYGWNREREPKLLTGTGEIGETSTGIKAHLFRPDHSVTREQFICMLARLMRPVQLAAAGRTDFTLSTDWQPRSQDRVSNYARAAVRWALDNGILADDPVSLRGKDPITRQEMAGFLYRFARFAGLELEPTEDLDVPLEDRFADGAAVSHWAQEPVAWAAGYGLLRGSPVKTDGEITAYRLDPKGTCTRAMAAQVIWELARSAGILTSSPWETFISHEYNAMS